LPEHAKKYFKEIIDGNNIYSFHKILIYFYLGRYRRRCSNYPDFVNFLYEVLDFYNFPSEIKKERQDRLRNIYKRIRQMSYLFLDSQYGPVPVNFNLSTIILNFSDYIPHIFKDYNDPIIQTLDSFENLLSTNVYHSAESIRELGFHENKIEKNIDNYKEINELKKITKLKKFFDEDERFRPEHRSWEDDVPILHGLLEFPSFPPVKDAFLNYFSCDREVEWNMKYGKSMCKLTFQADPRSHQLAINLSFKQESEISRNIKIVAKFLNDIIDTSEGLKNEEKLRQLNINIRNFVVDNALQRTYQGLLLSIIKYITNDNLYFEFKEDSIFPLTVVPIRGSKNAAKKIGERYKEVESIANTEMLDRSRLHELKILERALIELEHRSGLLLSLSPLLVYDEKRDPFVEIDGFCFGIKNEKFGVLLVEAKDTKKGSQNKAGKDLAEKFERLKFKTSEKPRIRYIKDGAYCYLPVDGKSL